MEDKNGNKELIDLHLRDETTLDINMETQTREKKTREPTKSELSIMR